MVGGFNLRDTYLILGGALCGLALVTVTGALLWIGWRLFIRWANGEL